MQIKTVWSIMDQNAQFDEAVNEALTDGWTLTKREVLPGEGYNETNWARRLLYAELVKEDKTKPSPREDEDDVLRAASIVRECCRSHDYCSECELSKVCKDHAPHQWSAPEV